MKYYIDVLKKYRVFEGRATRKEYWMFFLFHIILGFIFSFFDGFLNIIVIDDVGILYFAYSLVVLLPYLAVGVRRLHDTSHNGWWLIVPIVNIIFLATDSTPGENKYGLNPKEVQTV